MKTFKNSTAILGASVIVVFIFGFWAGYETCSIRNDVPGLIEKVNDLETVSVEVNEKARQSAVKVEEQIVTVEQSLNELRKTLSELKHRASQASDTVLDKVEEAGKKIEDAKKEATSAVTGSPESQ